MIYVEKYVVNMVQVNSYLVWDSSKEACIIDPGFMTDKNLTPLRDTIQREGLTLKRSIATHRHFDHYLGAERIEKEFGIIVEIPEKELELLPSMAEQMKQLHIPTITPISEPHLQPLRLEQDGTLRFGNTTFQVLETPGHSPGHVSFYYNGGEGAVFSGDVIFKGGDYGRYDLWGASYDNLMHSLTQNLYLLPSTTIVYPGHGASTTIGYEKEHFIG